MTGALVSVDLDRTMIYSRNALGAAFEDAVTCVEIYQDAPLSFMSIDAAESLRSLAAAALVVPTTTRTIEQFQRIALPGAPWRYAITSNGGNILVDGVPDGSWRAGFTADDLFCYLVVEPTEVPAGFLTEWSCWCAARGWNVSQQGRKIYTMPDVVSKSRAVAEVRARAIEDGMLDAGVAFLPKPFTIAQLAWKVREVLDGGGANRP